MKTTISGIWRDRGGNAVATDVPGADQGTHGPGGRQSDSAPGAWRVAGAERPDLRQRRSLGPGARIPPHRYRAGLRQRGERRSGLRESGVRRDEVFITTKFNPPDRIPPPKRSGASRRSASTTWTCTWSTGREGPDPGLAGNGTGASAGYARSIGVSNFDVGELERVMAGATIAPVVNQVQLNPFSYRRALLDDARRARPGGRGLQPARNRPPPLRPDHPAGGTSRGRTPAQVLLRWCIQHDLVVLPKSTHRDRIEENGQRSSTSPSPRTTWPNSTRSTVRPKPAAPSNGNGGDGPIRQHARRGRSR